MAIKLLSMVIVTASILLFGSIWFCRQDPFIRDRFSVPDTEWQSYLHKFYHLYLMSKSSTCAFGDANKSMHILTI